MITYNDNYLKYSELFTNFKSKLLIFWPLITVEILFIFSLKIKRLKRKAGHERSELTKQIAPKKKQLSLQ